jgi:hypothetical protein
MRKIDKKYKQNTRAYWKMNKKYLYNIVKKKQNNILRTKFLEKKIIKKQRNSKPKTKMC